MSEEPKKSKAVVFLTIIIVLLVGGIGMLGYKYKLQQLEAIETQNQLMAEKDSIANNLLVLIGDYEQVQTTNAALEAKLAEERENAKKLYEELQSVKRVSYSKIKEYQKELGTLRSIMKGMLRDIDSLNTMNRQLMAENTKVRTEMAAVKTTVKTLESRTEELSTLVASGSVIKARDIVSTAVNAKGKEVSKASRTNMLRTCFTLNENAIAKPGLRTVYMRVVGPDEFVLSTSEDNLFKIGDEIVVYSASREIDYQNSDVDMCIFYNNNGKLNSGLYKITLYLEGVEIGETELRLK